MEKILLIALVLTGLGGTHCQNSTAGDDFTTFPDDSTPNSNLVTTLLTALLNSEPFQYKLQKIYDFVDLKIRFFQLVKNVVTRENLLHLRSGLDLLSRTCNFLIGFLPEPNSQTDSPSPTFLESIIPLISLAPEMPSILDNQVKAKRSSEEEKKLLEEHKDDVINVAKLLYGTPT